MKLEAVLFDLDNTLINRKHAFVNYSDHLIDNYLIIQDEPDRARMKSFITTADRDGYRNKHEFYQELLDSLSWKQPISVDELVGIQMSRFAEYTVLMDGTIEVLGALKEKGIKLGLITNGSISMQNAKLDRAGLRKYFDCIIVSDEVKLKKPDKRIFDLALSSLQASAGASCYIGDHPLNDIQGASNAGLDAIWFEGFYNWDETIPKPERIIRHLREVLVQLGI